MMYCGGGRDSPLADMLAWRGTYLLACRRAGIARDAFAFLRRVAMAKVAFAYTRTCWPTCGHANVAGDALACMQTR